MGWISVDEQLPEVDKDNRYYYGNFGFDGQPFMPVIFYAPDPTWGGVCAGRFFPAFGKRKNTWFSLQGSRYEAKDVTHWMRMPAPPSPSHKESRDAI